MQFTNPMSRCEIEPYLYKYKYNNERGFTYYFRIHVKGRMTTVTSHQDLETLRLIRDNFLRHNQGVIC